VANDLLGGLIKTAIDAYIATLSDAEKADWTDAQRKTLLEKMFNPVEDYQAPIGSIIAWHKSLSGVPSLPGNWAECNGQTISDSDSPLDGVTLPDLNGDKRFLRGGSSSGTEQDMQLQQHRHLGGSSLIDNIPAPNGKVAAGGSVTADYRSATNGQFSYSYDASNSNDTGTNGTLKAGPETRPINMSVVFIIRIK